MTYRSGRGSIFVTAAAVYIVDRLTKLVAIRAIDPARSIEILKGMFHLTLVRNEGAAFGILKDHTYVFVAISVAVVGAIIFFSFRQDCAHPAVSVPLGLILGGTLGNLVDRLRYGHVVDFLDFRVWPVFNVADSCITVGAAILVAGMLAKSVKRKD